MKKSVWRAVIEVGFIIFLFYSNLLMGEFERSGMGQKRGVAWAIGDVFTAANFEIATIASLVGYVRRSVCGLRGPALIVGPRRAGDLPVLVHVVSQRARVLRLRRTVSSLAIGVAAVLPSSYSE